MHKNIYVCMYVYITEKNILMTQQEEPWIESKILQLEDDLLDACLSHSHPYIDMYMYIYVYTYIYV